MANYNTRYTLIEKIKNRHDDKSWEEFNYFYKAFIHSLLIRFGVSHTDRDDLVQKVLLKIWRKIPEFECRPGKSKFRNWISCIARTESYMLFRTHKRYEKKLMKAAENEASLEDEDPLVYQLAEEEWKVHISTLAWERIKGDLSETYRECFELLGQGLSVDEIAVRLELKKNTVYVYHQRVLQRLRRAIRVLDDELN